MQDDEKDDLIQKGVKEMIPTIKGIVTQLLLDKDIKNVS